MFQVSFSDLPLPHLTHNVPTLNSSQTVQPTVKWFQTTLQYLDDTGASPEQLVWLNLKESGQVQVLDSRTN